MNYDIPTQAWFGESSSGKLCKFSFDIRSWWYAGVLDISGLWGVAATRRLCKIIRPRGGVVGSVLRVSE